MQAYVQAKINLDMCIKRGGGGGGQKKNNRNKLQSMSLQLIKLLVLFIISLFIL